MTDKQKNNKNLHVHKRVQNRDFRRICITLNFCGKYVFVPEMPACDDVSCQLWQLINIYKSATKRIRANDRSARAFMRERMNLRTNVTGNEIHLFPISGRNRGE